MKPNLISKKSIINIIKNDIILEPFKKTDHSIFFSLIIIFIFIILILFLIHRYLEKKNNNLLI
jgi:hypothetical protein